MDDPINFISSVIEDAEKRVTDPPSNKPEMIGTVYTARAKLYNIDGKLIATCTDTPNAIAKAFMELPDAAFVTESYSSIIIPKEKFANRMQSWNVAKSNLEIIR